MEEKLKEFIENELIAIENNKTLDSNMLLGMKAAYLAIKNIFCGGND